MMFVTGRRAEFADRLHKCMFVAKARNANYHQPTAHEAIVDVV